MKLATKLNISNIYPNDTKILLFLILYSTFSLYKWLRIYKNNAKLSHDQEKSCGGNSETIWKINNNLLNKKKHTASLPYSVVLMEMW